MDVGLLALIGILALAATVFAWPALFRASVRRKKRNDPSYSHRSGLGVFDEIWHPHANNASQIIEIEKEVPAPPPLPGDPHRAVPTDLPVPRP